MLPAVLSPTGRRRNLLVLLAYGRLSAYVQMSEDERLAFEQELQIPGSRAGRRSLDELVEESALKKARLEERLPALASDEFCLAGSRPLFDEYEEKLRDRGPSIVPDFSSEEAAAARRRLAAATTILVPDFNPSQIPEYTAGRDRDDDVVIHTALLSRAEFVVSDDKHISVDRGGATEYADPDSAARVDAFTFDRFVETHVDRHPFELTSVDGGLLPLAYELLGTSRT